MKWLRKRKRKKIPLFRGFFWLFSAIQSPVPLLFLLGLRGGPFGFRESSWGRHFDILTASASDLIRFLDTNADALPHVDGVFGELQSHLPDIN